MASESQSDGKYNLMDKQDKPAYKRLLQDNDQEAAEEISRSEAEFIVAFMAGVANPEETVEKYSLTRDELRKVAAVMRDADLDTAGYGESRVVDPDNISPEDLEFADEIPIEIPVPSPKEDGGFYATEIRDMAKMIGVNYQGTKDETAQNINDWFQEKTGENDSGGDEDGENSEEESEE